MPENNDWQVLFVDDEVDQCELVSKYLTGKTVDAKGGKLRVNVEQNFVKAVSRLAAEQYDLLILDVRLGPHKDEREEEEGRKTLLVIKEKRFLPIIFYTALPNKVRDLETPLIRVVEKTEGVTKILAEIQEIFRSKIPEVNRELVKHVQEVQRDYMWDFVAKSWARFGDTPDRSCLAYLLARRLARSLDSPGIKKLAERLGDDSGLVCRDNDVHPMRYYVIPPIGGEMASGDIFIDTRLDPAQYLILVTPSCDIVNKKVDVMLFAECIRLDQMKEFTQWKTNGDGPKGQYKGELMNLLKNGKSERFYYLPGVFDLPDLVVDYQRLWPIEPTAVDKLKGEGKLECLASLDSPYSESMLARFSRYFGRLGTPDLNIEIVEKRLKEI
ncbi:MAG: hypothetical protein MUO80_03730 [Dehalococcoidia bacterium]|nr:hypothetical protein [Dehalococcoidia bacterium]